MPLSDREKRMLSLIEKQLRAEDPQFASRVQRRSVGVPRSRRRRGATAFVLGVLMLITGVAVPATMLDGFPLLSVLGFLVMFGGAIVGSAGASAPFRCADTTREPRS